ncbi:shock factor protein 4 [Seminavis robusta]|uniref:Shock factor protein 4 n=1 Tax=Seminavis robusta TaxID=568900 RepID=A0A9N8D908_9STRA|nr:shock factor protein 4 [Seminavis robusta]|eukprot:Sro42_g025600.1 shock factor protein 4 (365) ;mRNA; f:68826-69920
MSTNLFTSSVFPPKRYQYPAAVGLQACSSVSLLHQQQERGKVFPLSLTTRAKIQQLQRESPLASLSFGAQTVTYPPNLITRNELINARAEMILHEELQKQRALEMVVNRQEIRLRSSLATRFEPSTDYRIAGLGTTASGPPRAGRKVLSTLERQFLPVALSPQLRLSPVEGLNAAPKCPSQEGTRQDECHSDVMESDEEYFGQEDDRGAAGHLAWTDQDLKRLRENFPLRLYRILYEAERNGFSDIISFLPNGRAFKVHDRDRFLRDIMPRYFGGSSRTNTFLKQLNLYNFQRQGDGKDKGAYSHPYFFRGQRHLCRLVLRKKTRIPKAVLLAREQEKAELERQLDSENEVKPVDSDVYEDDEE